MTLRSRILLAVAGPSVGLLAAFSVVVYVEVRAARLADLDTSLAAQAATIASYVEHDGGWELDPLPDDLVAQLDGFVIIGEGEVLASEGSLVDRTWSGELAIESDGPPTVTVQVSRDVTPVDRAMFGLLVELAAVGLVLGGVAIAAAVSLSRRIVSSDDFVRLQGAWERQAAFTADASHELRTPLAVVRTQAEVALRQERTPEQYRSSLQGIADAARRMQELTEGLLLLARTDERVPRAPVDLAAVVRDAVEGMKPGAGVELVLNLPDHAPTSGDPRLLGVLVRNLAHNALRHTHAGSVVVTVMDVGTSCSLTVSDTGEGIAAEHVARVFERFYRVDGARSRASGGSGLGLAIVRTIAEQHGGSVSITSAPGRGTQVTVRLPKA